MKTHYKLGVGVLIITLVVLSMLKFKSVIPVLKQDDKEITLIEYNKKIANSQKLVLVYFWANWCSVCGKMKLIVNEIENENLQKIDVLRIDTDRDKEVAKKFEIDALPILILYKNGAIVWTYAGLVEKSMLKAQIEAH